MRISKGDKHNIKKLVVWLAMMTVAILVGFAGLYQGSATSRADTADNNLADMTWGLLPAGEGKTSTSLPNYSYLQGFTVSPQDWNPSAQNSPFSADKATLANPYIVGTSNPHTVSLQTDKDGNYVPSDARVGDTIQDGNGDTRSFKVTGFKLGAHPQSMKAVDPNHYDFDKLAIECNYFDFKVQEVKRDGTPVDKTGLRVAYNGTSQTPTILGFDQMTDSNDLAKVTITPKGTAGQGSMFTGSQTLYFALKAPTPGKEVPFNTTFNYSYSSGGYYDNLINLNPGPNWFPKGFGPSDDDDVKNGTVDKPIQVTLPTNDASFKYGIAAYNASEISLPITVDGKYGLSVASDNNGSDYAVSGFDKLQSGTTVPFKITYENGDYSLVYITFTKANTTNSMTVNYVDNDDSNKVVATDTVSGNDGTTGTYDVNEANKIPANYELADGQSSAIDYTIASGKTLTINLKHQTESAKVTTHAIINYEGAGSLTPAAHSIDVNWSGTKDKVTGDTSNWSTTNLPVTIPTPNVTGYTADHNAVTFDKVTGQTTSPADKSVTVHYTANSAPSNNGGGTLVVTPITSNASTTPSATNNTATSPITEKPATPTITAPSYAAKKGAAVYAIKSVYMYKNANFKKNQRMAKYPKAKRINRPMFVVLDYKRSTNGALRYKVRDVNHGDKTVGKIGYITANQKFVVRVYYSTMPKNKKLTVIAKKGVNAYQNVNLTKKAKHFRKGARITVKRIVKHHLTTRYVLNNGQYVTGNKKLVIQGNY